jgi:hypothetical protein
MPKRSYKRRQAPNQRPHQKPNPQLTYRTEITLHVELTFEILPALASEGLPAQIDITSVKVAETEGKRAEDKRLRRVELLPYLEEADLLLLECESVRLLTCFRRPLRGTTNADPLSSLHPVVSTMS